MPREMSSVMSKKKLRVSLVLVQGSKLNLQLKDLTALVVTLDADSNLPSTSQL
jgi:hypothetical protein